MQDTERTINKELKAFSVQANEYGCIRFAKSHVVARREGANELDVEFCSIESCRRIPDLDKYADAGDVPWRVLVEEHGWSQECGFCGHRVYDDVPERVWDGDEQVYCSIECQAHREDRDRHWEKERQETKQKNVEAEAIAKDRFAEIDKVNGYTNMGKTSVSFMFPGGKWPVQWRPGDELVSVSPDDVAAWEAYRGPYREKERLAKDGGQ